MSEATTAKKSAKKSPAGKVVKRPSDRKPKQTAKIDSKSDVVTTTVTMKGKRYQIRATKFLVMQVMKGSALITDWAEDMDENDEISTSELMELSDVYEATVKLFDATDGTTGRKGRPSSRDRVLDALNAGTLDLDDFTPAFQQLSGVVEKPGGRPLG